MLRVAARIGTRLRSAAPRPHRHLCGAADAVTPHPLAEDEGRGGEPEPDGDLAGAKGVYIKSDTTPVNWVDLARGRAPAAMQSTKRMHSAGTDPSQFVREELSFHEAGKGPRPEDQPTEGEPAAKDEPDADDSIEKELESVLIVETAEHARKVVEHLRSKEELQNVYHAIDTEVTDIDVSTETPVNHGRVTCVSVFCGPGQDLSDGRSKLWFDTHRDRGVLKALKSYLEDDKLRKVWHNYGFDRHVLENDPEANIKLRGFGGDTMHMARLAESSRKISEGYSLESLSGDVALMRSALEAHDVDPGRFRSKISMKKLFGKPKLKKDGTVGKIIELPIIADIQEDPEQRREWVSYSVKDAEATWFLREALEAKLRNIPCVPNDELAKHPDFGTTKFNTLWELYEGTWKPFGELLTDMEREGMLVDKDHLARAEVQAEQDKAAAEEAFRTWAARYCPDAAHMNVSSLVQVRQLLFAGCKNLKPDKPGVEERREFNVPNKEWEDWDAAGREGKRPPKNKKIELFGLPMEKPLDPNGFYTKTGMPQANAAVLQTLAGKRGAAKELRAALEAEDASKEDIYAQAERVLGTAYASFGGGTKGLEACEAIDNLLEAAAVDTLLSNFLKPLQGDNLRGKEGRVHCSLNLNTETGRLSARRPNLQNQPALEKDRYKIRAAFVAAPGNTLVVADYGQLELRLLAAMTDCVSMKEAFKAGGDFHSRTALGMYDHVKEAVDGGSCLLEWDGAEGGGEEPPAPLLKDKFSSERRKAKILNFSIAYGKTAFGLSKDWGVSKQEAEETVEKWYASRPEVKKWQDEQRDLAQKKGLVRTLLGRERQLPDAMDERNRMAQGHALRASINTPIQGGAADIVTLAMLQLAKSQKEGGELHRLGFKLLLQVHDEVILEGPEGNADAALAEVRNCMERPFDCKELGNLNLLDVELLVDGKYADNWYSAK